MHHSLRAWAWTLSLILSCCGGESSPSNSTEDGPAGESSELSIHGMSFNVRYGLAPDGENSWAYRKEDVIEVIDSRQPDFVGIQEAWLFQMVDIEEGLQGYSYLGRPRSTDESLGEATPILYQNERWQLDHTQHGTFWLSDTPEVPGSMSWGNTLPRIATWARLIHQKSKRGIYVFNTHLDHESWNARINGANLIKERVTQRLHPEPVIVTGDFNAGESSDVLGAFLSGPSPLVDTYRVIHPHSINAGTFHGFTGEDTGSRIDYVLVEPGAEVTGASIIKDHQDGRYPSDHFPVDATLLYAPSAPVTP